MVLRRTPPTSQTHERHQTHQPSRPPTLPQLPTHRPYPNYPTHFRPKNGSESFPFDKLPVELQLLVWQYAIADLAPVMAGDLNLSTTTLCLRGRSIDYAKDYLRLLSTCHLSRYEVFRNPPIFMVEAPDIPYFSNEDTTARVAVKSWHFGGMFTDILLDASHLGGLSNDEVGPGHDVVGEVLLSFFGPKIRRVHLFAGHHWNSYSILPQESRLSSAIPTTFRDDDALHFRIDDPDCAVPLELRETTRQRIHGERSRNVAWPVTSDMFFDGNYLVRPEDLVDLVTGIGAYLPRLEYVSLVLWTLPGTVGKTDELCCHGSVHGLVEEGRIE